METNFDLPKMVFFRNPNTRQMFIEKFDFIECISDVNLVTDQTVVIVEDDVKDAFVDMGEHKGMLIIGPAMFPHLVLKFRKFIDDYKETGELVVAAENLIQSLTNDTDYGYRKEVG